MGKFLKKKNIAITPKRYFLDAMSAMTQGLFATLIIGLIIKTAGEQLVNSFGENAVFTHIINTGAMAQSLLGAGIGVAVSAGLEAPLLVMICGAVTGTMGSTLGGPAGAYVAAVIGCEFGKAMSKETKLDIILTPLATLATGYLAAIVIGPAISSLMNGLGSIINTATELHPFEMGIIVSVVVGLVLTAPISSAALCLMISLSGLGGGAATAGCSAQMIGFAVISFADNGIGGFFAQGLGTSMLQVPNIIKNPWILLPPTIAAAITGPIATVAFKMTNTPAGSGMGTSGLVGQIGTLSEMGFTGSVFAKVGILHFLLPALLSYLFYLPLKKWGKIKAGDMKL
ncbi:MAG: PTS sugar transporter subunit IIC [Eubacteriaceae bacterium]|jgi:uncharacterized membrane protein|nr:PTS sugar transporter subunit IIC [Eubacteriaceae bacterium]